MINVNGIDHEARALNLPEVRKCRAADEDTSDILALSMSYGLSMEDATAWYNSTPAGIAAAAIGEVMAVSGLVEGAQKSG